MPDPSQPAGPPPIREVTQLSPLEEVLFRIWSQKNGVHDVDHPDSHYDYRGYYKATGGMSHVAGEHFPDTWKQHQHPTFSQESQYSKGPADGGMWQGDNFIAQPPMAVSHEPDPRAMLLHMLQQRP